MKRIRQTVINSKLFKWLYKQKNYSEVGSNQASFITSKLVEIFAMIALLEKTLNVQIVGVGVVWFGIGLFALSIIVGLFFKKTGLYDLDQQEQRRIDPVLDEMYRAAKLIRSNWPPLNKSPETDSSVREKKPKTRFLKKR